MPEIDLKGLVGLEEDTYLWKLVVKPNSKDGKAFEFCKNNSILGVGWCLRDANDNLYAIKNTDKSWEYCVSTRAKDDISASLYVIRQEGSIQVDACWKDTAAIRLVVCLKSNVMTKKYSGTWVIS